MTAQRFLSFIPLIFAYSFLIANENITVRNHNMYPIYAASYEVNTTLLGKSAGPATRHSKVKKIAANGTDTVERPEFHIWKNRELLLAIKSTYLAETIEPDDYLKMATFPIGSLNSSTCHVAEEDNNIKGYSTIAWNVFKPIFKELHKIVQAAIALLQKEYSRLPHTGTDAYIRFQATLSPEEQYAIAKRREHVSNAITLIAGTPISQDKVPCIALSLSGGGMRAALCDYGLFTGLEETKLLDTITYVAAVSGATWFLTDWLSYKNTDGQYGEHFIKALTEKHPFATEALSRQLLRKYIFEEDQNIVDLYSVYLESTFFAQEKNPDALCFSSIIPKIEDGSCPFPLCTCIETSAEQHWLTCTPYDIMSETLNFCTPIWSFGRKFVNGISTDRAPEYPLGYFMGIWGSALSGSIEDAYDKIKDHENFIIRKIISAILQNTHIGDLRPAAVYAPNPLYGMQESPHHAIKDFTLMDSWYSCNLPTPPLLHPQRNANIIIILDASESVHKNHYELEKAEELARQQGKLFPPIDYAKIATNSLTIFMDPKNSSCPAVVYIYPQKEDLYDPEFDPAKLFSTTYATARFTYTRHDAEKLAGLVRHIIAMHKEELYELIYQKCG